MDTIKSAGNGQENQSIFKIKSPSTSKSDGATFTSNGAVVKKDNVPLPLLSTSLSSPNLCISFDLNSSSASSFPDFESDNDDFIDSVDKNNIKRNNINLLMCRMKKRPYKISPLVTNNTSNSHSFNTLDCSSNDENDVEEETISGENDVEYIELSMTQRMPQDQITNTSVTDYVSLDDEFMLLSMFDDSPSNSFAVQDNNSTATSCEYIIFFFTNRNVKIKTVWD